MKKLRLSLKEEALTLRKSGLGIRIIEKRLAVSRSTLSGWFRSIDLTKRQKTKLKRLWMSGLVKARKKAALFHKNKKRERLSVAFRNGALSVEALDLKNKNILKLALAMLFVGEGFKAAEETSLGNSNPAIVKTFVRLIDNIYGFEKSKLRLYLHLRADQNIRKEVKFWSGDLEIDSVYFKIAPVDKRTVGKPTYQGYHGVCVVRYYDVSIKRELLALSENFFNKIIKMEL